MGLDIPLCYEKLQRLLCCASNLWHLLSTYLGEEWLMGKQLEEPAWHSLCCADSAGAELPTPASQIACKCLLSQLISDTLRNRHEAAQAP